MKNNLKGLGTTVLTQLVSYRVVNSNDHLTHIPKSLLVMPH